MLFFYHNMKEVSAIKLSELCEIRTGLILSRKQAKSKTQFYYKQLTLKSIEDTGYIAINFTEDFYSKEELNQDYLTKKRDIIVRLSTPYTAVLIDEDRENLVIPTHFAVVKCKKKIITPKYLYWFLNSKIVKKEYLKNNTSNMIGAIRPLFIGELEIKLPTMDKQEKIGEFNILAKKEEYLLTKLEKEKSKYTSFILENLYMKGNKNDN